MTTQASVTAPRVVDRAHPWPGLWAFEEGDGEFFKGREEEIASLVRLILREDLTLLWGYSGLGKTSLLRAGLFPKLRAADVFPVYVRLRYAGNGAATRGGSAAANLVEQCLDGMRVAADCWQYEIPEPAPSGTIWEYARRRKHRFWGAGDRLVTPLIVFDQFEELFTRDSEAGLDAESVDRFFRDVSDAIKGCPPDWLVKSREGDAPDDDGDYLFRPGAFKVLLSFREDFIAQVKSLTSLVGAIDRNFYRLTPMTFDQAVSAVEESGGHLIAAGSDSDRRDLCRQIVARVAGASTEAAQATATVDPPLLSLFCRELNERRLGRPQGAQVVDRELVESAEAAQIISTFYDASMKQVGDETRRFVEDRLVLPASRSRESVAEEAAFASGVPAADLRYLIDEKRILRPERSGRLGQARLELTHDVLVEPALAARERRRVEEARAEEEHERLEREEQDRQERERAQQDHELKLLRLEKSLVEERERAERESSARREAEQAREAEARERELEAIALRAQASSRRKKRYVYGLSALLGLILVVWYAVNDLQQKEQARRLISSTLERAVDDAASARPAQALARLAFVMRMEPSNVAARSLALDLLMRRTWLLPIASFAPPVAAGRSSPAEQRRPSDPVPPTPNHADATARVAFSADGTVVATTTVGGTLRLWQADTGEPIGAPREHGAPIRLVGFSDAGPNWLATASEDRSVRVWAPGNEAPAAIIPHDATLTAMAFGPATEAGGNDTAVTIATGTEDGWVRLWRIVAKEPPRETGRVKLGTYVSVVQISPDGTRVLAVAGSELVLWSPAADKAAPMRRDLQDMISAASFSPDGRTVASGTKYGRLILWSATTGLPVAASRSESPVSKVVFDREGTRLLSIVMPSKLTAESTAVVWTVPSRYEPPAPPGARKAIDLSAALERAASLERVAAVRSADADVDGAFVDDELLVMLTESGTVRLADPGTGLPLAIPLRPRALSMVPDRPRRKLLLTLRDGPPVTWLVRLPVPHTDLGSSQAVVSAQFSQDGRQVLTASLDGAARIWPASGGLPDRELPLNSRLIGAEYSRDGRLILTNGGDVAQVWKPSGELVTSIDSPGGRLLFARFDPGGRYVVTGSTEGSGYVWDAQSGRQVTELSEAGFWSADFSADGSRVVTAAHDGYAQVWDAKTGKPTGPRFTHTGQVVSAVFDGDGRRVVTASTDGTAKVWAVTTETTANAVPLFILKHADSVTSARFTPDGRQVVTTSSDWTARAWTLATAPASVIVMPHEAPVDIAELDPRGTRLLTVSTRAGTIRLWDVSTGRALTQVDVPRTLVLSARFSPDGQRIVSAWDDGYARLFDVPTGDAADSEWLAALAEAVSARRTDELGAVIVLTDQGKRLEGFRNEARQTGDKTGTFRQRWLRKLLLGGAAGI